MQYSFHLLLGLTRKDKPVPHRYGVCFRVVKRNNWSRRVHLVCFPYVCINLQKWCPSTRVNDNNAVEKTWVQMTSEKIPDYGEIVYDSLSFARNEIYLKVLCILGRLPSSALKGIHKTFTVIALKYNRGYKWIYIYIYIYIYICILDTLFCAVHQLDMHDAVFGCITQLN